MPSPRQEEYDRRLESQNKKRLRYNYVRSDNLKPVKLSSIEIGWLREVLRRLP